MHEEPSVLLSSPWFYSHAFRDGGNFCPGVIPSIPQSLGFLRKLVLLISKNGQIRMSVV
jgi:hypothetical protein